MKLKVFCDRGKLCSMLTTMGLRESLLELSDAVNLSCGEFVV